MPPSNTSMADYATFFFANTQLEWKIKERLKKLTQLASVKDDLKKTETERQELNKAEWQEHAGGKIDSISGVLKELGIENPQEGVQLLFEHVPDLMFEVASDVIPFVNTIKGEAKALKNLALFVKNRIELWRNYERKRDEAARTLSVGALRFLKGATMKNDEAAVKHLADASFWTAAASVSFTMNATGIGAAFSSIPNAIAKIATFALEMKNAKREKENANQVLMSIVKNDVTIDDFVDAFPLAGCFALDFFDTHLLLGAHVDSTPVEQKRVIESLKLLETYRAHARKLLNASPLYLQRNAKLDRVNDRPVGILHSHGGLVDAA